MSSLRAFFLASLAAAAGHAQALDLVKYAAFGKSATYAIAQDLGIFTAYGLNVSYIQVPNSTVAYGSLVDGTYDVTLGAVDNMVNRRFNSNLNLTVLGQIDGGPDLVIASVPNITSFAQLKGKPIIVDSPTSGFAYVLSKILSLNGVQPSDYVFQTVGGTFLRYSYLKAGFLPNGSAVYASISNAPFTEEGLSLPVGQRLNTLARVSDYVQPYSSLTFGVTGGALANATKRDVLERLVAAHYTANKFLARRSSKYCVVGVLASVLSETRTVAELNYEAYTDPLTGETSSPGGNFTVNRQGLLNVIDVRSQFGGFPNVSSSFNFIDAITPGPGKFIDYSIRDAALKRLRRVDVKMACEAFLGS